MRAILATVIICLFAVTPADTRGRFHHHGHHRVVHRIHEDFAPYHGGLVHERLDSGQVIVVASAYASRFVGFLNAVFHREGHLPEIGCYAPRGHMRNSLHHWGGACDVGQRRRNVAWRPMYHVTALAEQYGLTDGCTWNHPDCGHIDVSGVTPYHRYVRARRAYAQLEPSPAFTHRWEDDKW